MGRCDLIADEWPLPTGGNVAEPDFFHLIEGSMADKFRKVKHIGVIIGGEFWGFWMAGWMGWVVGIRTGFRHLRRLVYLGVGRSWMGPGHPAVAGVGRNAHTGVEASGRAEVCPDCGWRRGAGKLGVCGHIAIYRSPACVFAVFGAPATVIPACAGIRCRTSPATVMEPASIDSGFRRNDGWGGAGMVVGGSRYDGWGSRYDGGYDHAP